MSNSKAIKNIEQEISFLKITINHLATENESLKQKIEDLKITHQTNKDLLKEYLSQISNKDSTVQKLNNTIEQLKTRLKNLDPPSGKKGNSIITSNYDMVLSGDDNPDTSRNIKRNCLTTRHRSKKNLNQNSSMSQLVNLKEMSEVKFRKYTDEHSRILKELHSIKESLIEILNEKEKENNDIKIINNYHESNTISSLFQKEKDSHKVILFIDNNNSIWELTPESELTEEDIMKIRNKEKLNSSVDDTIGTETSPLSKGKEINIDNMSVEISQRSSLSEDNEGNLNNSHININHEINSLN